MLERYTALHQAREHHGAAPGHASELGTLAAAVFRCTAFSTASPSALLQCKFFPWHHNCPGRYLARYERWAKHCDRRTCTWKSASPFDDLVGNRHVRSHPGCGKHILFSLADGDNSVAPGVLCWFLSLHGCFRPPPGSTKSRSPVIAVATVSGMVLVFFSARCFLSKTAFSIMRVILFCDKRSQFIILAEDICSYKCHTAERNLLFQFGRVLSCIVHQYYCR